MAFDINFNALQPLDVAGSFYRGQQMGREMRKQDEADQRDQVIRQAFATYDQDPEGAIKMVMGVDPETGMKLQERYAGEQAAQRRQQITGAYAGGDEQGARQMAIQGGDLDLAKQLGELTKEQREIAKQNAEELLAIGYGLKKYQTVQERQQVFQSIIPELRQRGYSDEMLAQALNSLDDQSLDASLGQAMSIKDLLDREFKTQEFGLKRDQFGETQRHNRATEGNAAGNLALSRERHRATVAGQGGYGMGGQPQYVDPNDF